MENNLISIVIPVYNEAESLKELTEKIKDSVIKIKRDYEIIYVNDGSIDNSLSVLKELAQEDKNIKVISFILNFGQTAALTAGIDSAKGDIIITLDSDLENDPKDILDLIKKLNEGYDVVSGWRKSRWKNSWITRKIPSIIANSLISKVTKIKLHDYGCTLKAYRKSTIENINLYGEMHRFIPVFAAMQGAKVTEMQVNYEPRKHGKSNYGISRIFKVLSDLTTVLFLLRYFTKPMHFFGQFGMVLLFLGFLSGISTLYIKLAKGVSFIATPLPLLTVVLGIIGIQFILMGLLAEIIIRTYYESQKKTIYKIKEKINF